MRLCIFTVFDSALGLFVRPFYMRTRGEAIRSFTDEVNRPDSEIGKHADHYGLYYVGTYEEEGCVFNLVEQPERVMLAVDALKDDAIRHLAGGRLSPLSTVETPKEV